MTNELLAWILALLGGAVLGAIFFGGLWWTVRKGLSARMAGLLFLASMLVRSAIVIAGFYFIAGDSWEKLAAALVGFVVMRGIIGRIIKPVEDSKTGAKAAHRIISTENISKGDQDDRRTNKWN